MNILFKSLILAMALPLAAAASPKAKVKTPIRPVNLNTATQTELMQLPHIGAKTAERILAFRKEHGGFQRPEELMNVKGVGEKSFARLRHFLQGASVAKTPAPAK
jgi:competence protein ComEA